MLMNIDSKIAEYFIKDFVRTDTPILTVHDRFIIPFREEDRLEKKRQDRQALAMADREREQGTRHGVHDPHHTNLCFHVIL